MNRYYVLGWDYNEKHQRVLVVMKNLCFDNYKEADIYAKSCHQAYKCFVVCEVEPA